jgi:hypothetical protein
LALLDGLELELRNHMATGSPPELANCDAVQDVPLPITEVEPCVSVTDVGGVVHDA